MAIVNYHCAKGRLIGEDTNGIRTDYMTDALGSVTGTVNSSQEVVNTYRYKPFGELLAKTGSGADPKFMWNGAKGIWRSSISGLVFAGAHFWPLAHATSLSASVAYKSAKRFRQALMDPRVRQSDCDLSAEAGTPVPYHTTAQPYLLFCGAWQSWDIKFDLAALRRVIGSGLEGFIIQEITYHDSVSMHCEDNSPPPTFKDYFEVWYLTSSNRLLFSDNDTDVTQSTVHDRWTRDTHAFRCRQGKESKTAYLKFYPAKRSCASEWGYRTNNVPSAGALQSGFNPPTGWSRNNSVVRQASSSFNCCKINPEGNCRSGFSESLVCDLKKGSYPTLHPLAHFIG